MTQVNRPEFDENSSLTDLMEEEEEETDGRLNDENEPRTLQYSPYFNNTEFIKFLKDNENTFKLISLNCQSLNAKFEMLRTYISTFNESNSKLDAICLQETWLTADADLTLLQLPGYNLISQGKSCSAWWCSIVFE